MSLSVTQDEIPDNIHVRHEHKTKPQNIYTSLSGAQDEIPGNIHVRHEQQDETPEYIHVPVINTR